MVFSVPCAKKFKRKKENNESRFDPISVRVRQFTVNFPVKFAIISPRRSQLSSGLNLFIDEKTSCFHSIFIPELPM